MPLRWGAVWAKAPVTPPMMAPGSGLGGAVVMGLVAGTLPAMGPHSKVRKRHLMDFLDSNV